MLILLFYSHLKMTSDRSKRRDLLALTFVTKLISKKLHINTLTIIGKTKSVITAYCFLSFFNLSLPSLYTKQRLLFSDTDECAVSNGGCSHQCVNTAPGYRCKCPEPDLYLSSDNKTCVGTYSAMLTTRTQKQYCL